MPLRSSSLTLLAAFVFGVLAAVLKGRGSGFAYSLGNLSAPWLLVAFLAGRRFRGPTGGGLMGLLATGVALLGFYCAVVLNSGQSAHLALGPELHSNARYFMGGLVTGPLFGTLGGVMSRSRPGAAYVVAGILISGEPLVRLLTPSVHVFARYAGTIDPTLFALEFFLGAGIAASALVVSRARRGTR